MTANRQIAGAIVVLGALGGTAGAVATFEALRFWAGRGEFEAAAMRVYEMTSDKAAFARGRAEEALAECRADPDARCWFKERDLRKAVEAYEAERARYKHYGGE